MQTISNSPNLEWQLANGMVSQHLIKVWEFDIEVIKWLDGKRNRAFNKMFLHPIESGNYIELNKKDNRDHHGYIIKFKDLVNVRVIEEIVGSIRKRPDLLLELSFGGNFSDDAVSHNHTIIINVEDKHAFGIVDLLKRFKDMEEDGAYWTKSKIIYRTADGQQRSTEIFLEAPFFAQDEMILWVYMIKEKDKKSVIYIRLLTNFRIFEYNYKLHVGRAKALKDIEDVLVTNVVDKKRDKSDYQYGIFIDSNSALDTNGKNTTKIKTIGDVAFITKEGQFVKFYNVSNPEYIAQIVKMQKEKILSFETNIQVDKKTPNWKGSFSNEPFHIPTLLGEGWCAICNKELGFMRYTPKKEWYIDGQLCSECFENPTKLGVRQISSEEDSKYACVMCGKNVYYFEFESENLCFSCFEQKYGKVLLTANRAEYYGGHKVHLAGGTFSEYESGKMYLTEVYLIFAKGNKDVSKRWEIMIPLSSVMIEQWNVKGESRRKQITAGGLSSNNIAFGGGAIHETGQRHRLAIPYIDENSIVQQPVFGVSSFGGKDIRIWAEKLYEQLVKVKQRSPQNIQTDDDNDDPIAVLKLRFAKGEISKKEYEEMRKMIES